METLTAFVKKSWRAFMTAVFVLLVFTVPASKGILGKIFGASAAGKQQADNKNNNNQNQGNNKNNNNNQNQGNNKNNNNQNQANNPKHNDTGTASSGGAPMSNPPASPVKHGDTCSTGRQHNASHGNHHRAGHRHYYKPNAK